MITVEQLISGTAIEPRPYQSRIVTQVIDLFANKGRRSVLIESPTGSGKTVMGLMTAWALQKELGVSVGWVAMRRNLLTQTAEEITERGMGVNVSFISMFEKDPPKNLDLLVVDEAQHDAANSMANLHSIIRPKYILGLSATPFRADKMKLCFDKVIRDAGIRQLINEGFLSQFDHYTIDEYSPASVARHYLAEREHWGKSISYFHKVEQCYELQRLLALGGVHAEVVTGSSDRDAQISAFEKGEVNMLINCMVLTEGFDCPSLKTVFCRPSGKGVTVQMAGRALRRFAALPVKQIVQCQKTTWPFVKTAQAKTQYVWERDHWVSRSVNPLIEEVSFRVLKALAATNVELPEFVRKRMRRSRRRDRLAVVS